MLYSGILNGIFPPHRDKIHAFPLDQAGDSLVFQRKELGTGFFHRTDGDYFRVDGIVSAAFRRGSLTSGHYTGYVSKLSPGQNVSSGYFAPGIGIPPYGGIMVNNPDRYSISPWRDRGTGYVGFRFNNGAGLQYGWVRVRMGGPPEHPFEVVSYAYADPGEPIRAGQRSSAEQAPDQGSTDQQTPNDGSLGGLALGAVGLMAWRKCRSRTARLEDA